ncbi:MAG TPA: NADH-quinone oxidoreductase subunit N [Longimicrobiales bacterium]|nr:NADH-quinone oxidoreductase subunit N [Longimicrobiales bacterium]
MPIDYSTPLHYFAALLPEVVLTIGALVVLMVDVFQRGEAGGPARPAVAWLTVLTLAAAAVANGWLLGLEETAPAAVIALDGFRVYTNFLFLGAAALFVPLSWRHLGEEKMRHGEVYVLILLATIGMMFFAGTRDLMLIFLGLELMSVAVYVLTGLNRRDRRSAEAALKYVLLGAFSSAFFLFGIAMVYGGAGSVNLIVIRAAVGIDGVGANLLLTSGMAFLAIGFAFKVAAVPFHMWTPDAYEGAPASVTAFMAAAVKAAAFAAFLRVFLVGFGGMYETWGVLTYWLAVATMVVANLVALAEDSVKRMLAYSSIAHAGYLLVALTAATNLGAASYLYYLVVYTLMTMGSFAVVYLVAGRHELRLGLAEYGGLGWRKPVVGVTMTVFLLSLAGVPPTGGFWGKFAILRSIVERGGVELAVVLVLTSLVSYYYYLRVAWYMWFREAAPGAATPEIHVSAGVRTALVAAAVAVLLLGIFPGELLEVAERTAATLTRPLVPGIAAP